LIGVGFFAEPIDFGDDFQEGGFGAVDRMRAVILALLLQALVMLDELFAIELG
jgi:hypothetical protein